MSMMALPKHKPQLPVELIRLIISDVISSHTSSDPITRRKAYPILRAFALTNRCWSYDCHERLLHTVILGSRTAFNRFKQTASKMDKKYRDFVMVIVITNRNAAGIKDGNWFESLPSVLTEGKTQLFSNLGTLVLDELSLDYTHPTFVQRLSQCKKIHNLTLSGIKSKHFPPISRLLHVFPDLTQIQINGLRISSSTSPTIQLKQTPRRHKLKEFRLSCLSFRYIDTSSVVQLLEIALACPSLCYTSLHTLCVDLDVANDAVCSKLRALLKILGEPVREISFTLRPSLHEALNVWSMCSTSMSA